jgi:hypothetical protein
MLPYLIAFLAIAVFPLALAGVGGHLAAVALPDQAARRRTYFFVIWGLALIGIVLAGLQQIEAFHSDKEHDAKQELIQGKLDTSLQRGEYMRGQLESISLMLGKVGEGQKDPAVSQLAGVIVKMADNAKASSPPTLVVPDLHLGLLYEGANLNGRSLGSLGENAKTIKLVEFQIHNGAERATGATSLRLYFSKPVTASSPLTPQFPWQPTPSDEINFPAAFYSTGAVPITINPTETWNWPAFSGQLTDDFDEVSAKLKVFYGSARPAEASFLVHSKKPANPAK